MDSEQAQTNAHLRGRRALEDNKLNLALNHLCSAVRSEPTAEIFLDLASVYEKLGRGNVRIVYLDKAISLAEPPSLGLREELRTAKNEFLKKNEEVSAVLRLFVKNPNAPRIKAERDKFFHLVSQRKTKAAFLLGLQQHKSKRVDPHIQGVWASIAYRHGEQKLALNASLAAFIYEPRNWVTINNLADILIQQRHVRYGLDFALAAVNLNPVAAGSWINLAAAFENQGSHWEAAKACREAIKRDPKDGMSWTNLGNSLKNSGRASEATDAFREAVKLDPDNLAFWSNYLFGILYDPNLTELQMAQEAFKFGEYWEAKIKPVDHSNRLVSGMPSKLRIGFVSADIRSHPVAYFFEPLLEHLDRKRFEIYIYDNYVSEDMVTTRFKNFADRWQNVSAVDDQQLVKMIIKDKIDVLVDMSGHTARNRLRAFAYKPAPVQVTWLGHPGTTGLTRMDWRFGDPQIEPDDAADNYSEKIYFTDMGVCYVPLVKMPELRSDPKYHVNPTPALLNGYVTFGSCNNLAKLNQEVVRYWAAILKSVPNSKLLLESPGLEQAEFKRKVVADFEQFGVSEDRLQLYSRDSSLQYLRYHDIDIALDPFPYGGGTTTCDLLWMGIPLVTLKSETVMGRAGNFYLLSLGKEEWVASSEEEYVAIAKTLASDVSALNEIRHSLRPIMEKSVLMNGPRFAEKFGGALIDMYQRARAHG